MDFKPEYIRIHKELKKTSMFIYTYYYIDRDTKCNIIYCPSLDISAYGDSEKEAQQMFEIYVHEFFNTILTLKTHKAIAFLGTFGWKQEKFQNKNFSKSYVDQSGKLSLYGSDVKVSPKEMVF